MKSLNNIITKDKAPNAQQILFLYFFQVPGTFLDKENIFLNPLKYS